MRKAKPPVWLYTLWDPILLQRRYRSSPAYGTLTLFDDTAELWPKFPACTVSQKFGTNSSESVLPKLFFWGWQ
jgi:hypothetical protein